MLANAFNQTVLYKNARLVDGVFDRPLNGVSILVDGERYYTGIAG